MEQTSIKKQITFAYPTREECAAMGEAIHSTLVGNPDYIDNRIVLNIDGVDAAGNYLCTLTVCADAATDVWGRLLISTPNKSMMATEPWPAEAVGR